MDAISILAKKRDGLALSREEIRFFVRGCVDKSIPDYQAAAFLMAVRINGFTHDETLYLTLEMAHSGEMLDLSDIPGIKVDKHSTGGVGDKVSLILMPIAAAAGLKVAKMSGRGLGHTGGTLDKLEAIPGFQVSLPISAFKEQVRTTGISIISQSANLAPADKLFYALRDVTATVDSIPLISASIMSKKLAMGAQVLLLDVKCGSGALIQEIEGCRQLAKNMVEVGKAAGIQTIAAITDMNQPLGNAVGNALEVREALQVLRNGGPADLRKDVLALAAAMFCQAGLCATQEEATALAAQQLESGAAFAKFVDFVRAQGGDSDFAKLPEAGTQYAYRAAANGWITGFDATLVGKAAMVLGAGRLRMEDQIDPAAGLLLQRHIGDPVQAGDIVAVLHTNTQDKIAPACAMLDKAVRIGQSPLPPPPSIYEFIS